MPATGNLSIPVNTIPQSLLSSGWDVHALSHTMNNLPFGPNNTGDSGSFSIVIDQPNDTNVTLDSVNFDNQTKTFDVNLNINMGSGDRRLVEYTFSFQLDSNSYVSYFSFSDSSGNKKKAVSSNAAHHPEKK